MVRVFDSDNNAKAAWRALETVVRQRGEEPATFQQGIIATGGREDVTRRGHRSNDTTYRDSNSHYRQTCCATFYDFFVSSLRAWPSVDEVPRVVLDRWSENFGGKLRVSGGSCSILIEIRGWWMDRSEISWNFDFSFWERSDLLRFLCLWGSSDLRVMWFLFLKIRERGTLNIFDTMLKDNIKWRGIKYFQLMRVICEEIIYYIWFIYKWWEILFYFYCLIIWTFFY